MEHRGREHIGDGVEGQIGEPQLGGQEHPHDQAEGGQDQAALALSGGRGLAEHGGEGIEGDQQQQRDLEDEHRIAQGKRGVDGSGVHGEEDGNEDVHERKEGDSRGKNIAGEEQEAAEGAVFLQVGNDISGPVQNAGAHREIIHGGIGKEQEGELPGLKNAPEDIRYVIGQDREQESPVRFPGGLFCGQGAAEENIPVHDEEDQDGQEADGGVVHAVRFL